MRDPLRHFISERIYLMKNRISLLLAALMLLSTLAVLAVIPASAATITMTPLYGEKFQPDGVTFGRVSFTVPGNTQGLTKDAWDGSIDHNTDLILITYTKNGETYVDKTIREIKAHLGNLALVRTCYTYDNRADGTIQINLVFHMDDHSALKPADIVSVTVKAGFVWCAGSPSGITGELKALTLEQDVTFLTKGTAGITGVQTGNAGSSGTSVHVRFDRKDNASLKAISAVNLCPSAIPGKTLGDLVTIGGVTVTELVKQGKVARFNFYGDTLVFHVDDNNFRNKMFTEHLEVVILPGFQWLTWNKDDWGNWAGTNANNYTVVPNSLVLKPIAFYFNEQAEVCVKTDGITVEPGYKDTYYVGQAIDMTTLLIRINYAGGNSEVMPILESMVSYDFSKAGTATVNIDVKGMKASYTVTVVEDPNTEAPTEEVTEPETEAPTEAPTDPVTEAVTEAPTEPLTEAPTAPVTETTSETEAQKTGCGASVLSVLSLLSAAVAVVALKKKEN